MKKTTLLKNMIYSGQLEFLMEAHNGLSAKIVERAGFKAIWASGLSISAQLGLRDNNEASWTQMLEVWSHMADATEIPILVDGDTGYGNFNNFRRLVCKLEQQDIAGVCIEDKIFPKTNSFIQVAGNQLADIDEMSGKIKAGKDAQKDADFVIVARTEGFISGVGLEEVLRRAHAYQKAGADAVLIHSKRADACEIEAFMAQWNGACPVVIVPTKYYQTPTAHFRQLNISLVIWANHIMRSAITAMEATAKEIFSAESLASVEIAITGIAIN